jgi:hypothetical protein
MTNAERDERANYFQHLVLQGIYGILRCFIAMQCPQAKHIANDFRINALGFGDMYGLQTEAAKEYRRSKSFPEIHW